MSDSPPTDNKAWAEELERQNSELRTQLTKAQNATLLRATRFLPPPSSGDIVDGAAPFPLSYLELRDLVDRALKMMVQAGYGVVPQDSDHNNPIIAWMADARAALSGLKL